MIGTRSAWALSLGATLTVTAACTSSTSTAPEDSLKALPDNHYAQTNLVASEDEYGASSISSTMVNAWGLAIRPKGAGGHFWVGAGGSSFEFVGDVTASSEPALRQLHRDALHEVTVPGADADTSDAGIGKTTGVVFNPAPLTSDSFVVTEQPVQVDGQQQLLSGSSRFLFATDTGHISGWTERGADGNVVRQDGPAKEMFNGESAGMNFFGLAVKPGSNDTLWAADFGAAPQIRQFDKNWQLVPTQGFVNPFATGDPVDPADPNRGKQARPGDPAPFNITAVGERVFVTYATTKAPDGATGAAATTEFDAGEEDSLDADQETAVANKADRGKLAEFDSSGNLVRTFEDGGRLNAPWGVAVAPADFGALSGKLLVGNFAGAGHILAFDDSTGEFVDYVRGADSKPVAIEGLWALLFGNGESLGDSNALYFTAGPEDEKDGLFGALRAAH